jgi:hypothetical protein
LLHPSDLLRPSCPFQPDAAAAEEQAPSEVQFSNSLDESFYFSRLGVGISHEELTQILQHMRNECSKLPLRSARFFGKIYGADANYYVVEAEPAGEIEEEEAPIAAEEAAEAEPAPEEEAREEEEGEEAIPEIVGLPKLAFHSL